MAVHEVSEDYPAFLMNTTETQKLASDPEEDVSDLELAISSLRGVTFAAASAGIVANVLAFMSARRLGTKTSGTALIKNLCLLDSASAIIVGLLPCGSALAGKDFMTINDYTCKAEGFLGTWLTLWANYVLVGLSVDRLIAVWRHEEYRLKSKMLIGHWATMVVGFITALVSLPVVASLALEGGSCFIGSHAKGILTPQLIQWYIMVSTIGVLLALPLGSHLILDSLILFKLISSAMTARSRSATTNSNASIVSIGRKEKEITTSLLLVCFFYMVTASVAAASFIKIVTMEGFSKRELKLRTLFTSISQFSVVLNHSMNLLFYLIGAKSFRIAFKGLFGQSVASSN